VYWSIKFRYQVSTCNVCLFIIVIRLLLSFADYLWTDILHDYYVLDVVCWMCQWFHVPTCRWWQIVPPIQLSVCLPWAQEHLPHLRPLWWIIIPLEKKYVKIKQEKQSELEFWWKMMKNNWHVLFIRVAALFVLRAPLLTSVSYVYHENWGVCCLVWNRACKALALCFQFVCNKVM